VVCDLDGLKLINDTMGHDRGDELLKTAAQIIRRPFRSSDVVARVGGDEFAVILPSTDEKSVADIAARIQKAVEEHNRQKNGIPLSLSVGFATGTDVSRGILEIFKQADSNMYKNKFGRREAVKKRIIDHMLSLLADKDFQDEKYEERLQRMVLLLGQAIGLPSDELKEIMRLARLHDIGKVGIDDSILFKKEALNKKE
jgi:diguanylate cyclase (GGDEF)-like protein